MKERELILIMTGLCVLLCACCGVWCIWFARHGAYGPAVLNAAGFLITLMGAVYSGWWLRRQKEEQ